MPGPILLDLSHTSHSAARTGVQRVALGLQTALEGEARGITYDPYAEQWRDLESWELRKLSDASATARQRGVRWPWTARARGRLRWAGRGIARKSNGSSEDLRRAAGLIVPEIFSAEVGAALPGLMAELEGPAVALFHDAIALRMPELAPPNTVARFPAYLRELALFDGIAAVSDAARAELLSYWEWAGIRVTPPVITIPLGIERPAGPSKIGPVRAGAGGAQGFELAPGSASALGTTRSTILSVGTIEGRKNHLALLQACELLWERGLQFNLHLIGFAQRQTGAAALELIDRLRASGRPVRYDAAAGDEAREAAYAAAAFTIYPSLAEGFGLPVAESLVRGKPCICSYQGALGEVAVGGGCLTVPEPTRDALAAACGRLLEDGQELAALTAAAQRRVFPTPADHARQLLAWMGTLRS